jgi:hypothetical protein
MGMAILDQRFRVLSSLARSRDPQHSPTIDKSVMAGLVPAIHV